MQEKIKKIIQFITNPRLLLGVGIAWIITNGWSYILFWLGTKLQSGWMLAISTAYLTFLWLPVSPEKIVTFSIAIGLLRFLFPNDKKTLAVLREFHEKAKALFRSMREKHRQKRRQKQQYRKTGTAN